MTQLSLITELEKLAASLSGDGKIEPPSLPSVAEQIAKSFGVKSEEVAILGISEKWKHLHFLVPESLKNVGFIPLASNSALAARTVREKRAEIVNKFAAVPHASIFEGVKSASTAGEAIQKIVSAPIFSGDKVIGVMQISRKGSTENNAGPDFSNNDLGKVVALCGPLGKFLHHFAKE
jgi:hypothetical protein